MSLNTKKGDSFRVVLNEILLTPKKRTSARLVSIITSNLFNFLNTETLTNEVFPAYFFMYKIFYQQIQIGAHKPIVFREDRAVFPCLSFQPMLERAVFPCLSFRTMLAI